MQVARDSTTPGHVGIPSMDTVHSSNEAFSERLRTAFPACAQLPHRLVRDAGVGTHAIILGETHIALVSEKSSDISPLRGSHIANLVRRHLTTSVPVLVGQCDEILLFQLIPGQPLTAARLQSASPRSRRALAVQLGGFLRELHGLRVTSQEATLLGERFTSHERILARISSYEQRLFPRLIQGGGDLARLRLAQAQADPALWQFPRVPIHADLTCDHLLVDGQLLLQGVIDFGGTVLGDPAEDFARLLICYGRGFTEDVALDYPDSVMVLKRAAVLAHMTRYDWLLNGLDGQGDRWFLLDALVATDF